MVMAICQIVTLAAVAPLLGLVGAASAGPAPGTYIASLTPVPLNGASAHRAGGQLRLTLRGTTAEISVDVHGLGATYLGKPYPHPQHIHGLARGMCPTAEADTNHDKVISDVEAVAVYGLVLTTLSATGDTSPVTGTDTTTAPTGSAFHYTRTIPLDPDTRQALANNTAVIVVTGLDLATAAPAAGTESSVLVPALPLGATAPALCGKLVAPEPTQQLSA
jgi:hypothetical protein